MSTTSVSAREAADGLRDLSQLFKKVIRAGEVMEGIASIEQVTAEATRAADLARKEQAVAEDALAEIHADIAEAEARVPAINAQLNAEREKAKLAAHQLVARAEVEAQAIVAEAQAKADAIAATLRQAQADAAAAVQDAVAKQQVVDGLAEQVRTLRATAAKIAS